MKAVVMAGGLGSRLRPLTVGRPKPLLPLVNKPVIAHIVDWLKRHAIDDIVITLQHQAVMFQEYLGTGSTIGVSIEYVEEESPLGTAGCVANVQALGKLDKEQTIVVVSGDAVTDIDLDALIEFHRSRNAEVTIALYRVPNPLDYGMVITEADGRIAQFLEKPGWAEVVSDTVNTGIYVIETSLLQHIPEGPYDFSNDLFPRLLEQGHRLYGFVAPGYWCDVGTPSAFLNACSDILNNQVRHEPLGKRLAGDIWVGDNVQIDANAHLFGPIYLGSNVKIKSGAVIQGPTVIRDNSVVDSRASISRSVLWRGCYVGEDVQMHGALVGRHCVFKRRSVVQDGAVIGDLCLVGEDAVISANVKLWPSKEIESGAQVRSSIVWGSQGRRVLFGRFGITGVVNVEITPEFAAKVGVAFGATLPMGSSVTINRDAHPSSRMLKRAIISGLPAAGVNVIDLRSQPVPVARYFTRLSGAVAGVHVRISPYDWRVADIRFVDADGRNLPRSRERDVERLFFREDFRRAQLDDIGTIDYALDVERRYTDAFMQALDRDLIRQAGFTIAVDYAHADSNAILEPIWALLGIEVVGLNTRSDPSLLTVSDEEWKKGVDLLTRLVRATELDLGARLDSTAEKVLLVDGRGRSLDGVVAAAAVADLVWRTQPDAVIAVPVNRPSIFEQLAARHGGRVVRTRVDIQALMSVVSAEKIALAVDGDGYYIFPDLQPTPDGMFALARILQYLAQHHLSLKEVVEALPSYALAHKQVKCPWESKGRVMREISQRAETLPSDVIDGVKFFVDDDRWVLIRPDPDRAMLHVTVEVSLEEDPRIFLNEQLAWLRPLINTKS